MTYIRRKVRFTNKKGGTTETCIVLHDDSIYRLEISSEECVADFYELTNGEWILLAGTADEDYCEEKNDFAVFSQQIIELWKKLDS